MPPLENTGAGAERACWDVLKNVYRDVQMMEALSIGAEAQRCVREVLDARLLEDVLRCWTVVVLFHSIFFILSQTRHGFSNLLLAQVEHTTSNKTRNTTMTNKSLRTLTYTNTALLGFVFAPLTPTII